MMPEDWNHMRNGSMLNLKNMQKIWDISLVPCHMKGHEASIFHRKTRHQAFPVFMVLADKKATGKTYLLHYNIWLKTLYTTLQVLLHWNVSTYYIVTRLCNIFETANTKTLIKAVLESPYKPLNKP